MKLRLATTHPIQYQVPWFRELARRAEVELEVGFASLPDPAAQGTGFGVPFAWDQPLLEHYRWRELERSNAPVDLSRFRGLRLRRPGRWLNGGDALVVTGWNSWALVQLALAARRRRIPVVVRGDSHAGRRRPLAVRLTHRALFRLFSAFLVVGQLNRELYLGAGVEPSRLFDGPHFVDNARFAQAAAAERTRRTENRARWRVPQTALTLLFAGKLQRVKNLFLLLSALERLRGKGARLHLLIAGEGEQRGALEQAVHMRDLPVTFTGFLNQGELPAAYAAADLLVLPSHSETWGLVVNEAMASGLPAIVSDAAGCAPDLVVEGETGWTFSSGDAGALARRIGEAAAAPERLLSMGENAARRVTESFSVERVVEGTLAALAFVLRRS